MMERLLWVLKDNLRAAQLGLAGEKSINAPIHNDAEVGEWQVHLVDRSPSPEAIVLDQDDFIEYDEAGRSVVSRAIRSVIFASPALARTSCFILIDGRDK